MHPGCGEFEVGLGELAGLHILGRESILLDGSLLHIEGPVILLGNLSFERHHGQVVILGQANVAQEPQPMQS